MQITKSKLILPSLILLSIGVFVGNKINKQNQKNKYEVLRTTYVLEMEQFIWDLEQDVKEKRMDSLVAGYYIHNFKVIYHELTNSADNYIKSYEKDWYKD